MNTNVKKILLTGTALVAASFIGAGSVNAQQQISANGQTVTTAGAGAGVNFQGNFTADNGAVATVIGGPVTTVGNGTLNFTGGTNSVAGSVGALTAVGISGTGTVTFANGTFGAGTLSLNGGTANFGTTTMSTTSALTVGANGGTIGGAGSFMVAGAGTTTISSGGALTISTTGKSDLQGLTIGAGGGTLQGNDVLVTQINGNAGAGNTGTISAGVGVGIDGNPIVTVSSGTLAITHATSEIAASTVAASSTLNFGGASTSGIISGAGTFGLIGTNQSLGANVTTTSATVTDGVNSSGAGAINVTNFTKTNAGTGTATIGNALTTTALNVQNGTLTVNGATTATTLNMGEAGQNRTTVFNGTGTPATVTNLNHLGSGSSTISNALTATNTGVSGGGTLTATGSTLGAVTFGAGGGTVATGTGITSITGAADFTGTGTVTPQVTNIAVTTTAGGTGTVVVSNAASTLSGATLASGTGLTFGGTTIGAVTGAGSTLTVNAAGAQTLAGVGASGNALTKLVLDGSGTKTLNNAIFATTTEIDSGVTAQTQPGGAINGAVAFTGDGSGVLNLAGGVGVTGAISTSAANTGTVNFNGASTIGGDVGTGNAIGTLHATTNNGAAITFNGSVNAQNLTVDDVTGSPNITLNGTTNTIANAVDFKAGTFTLGNAATLGITNGGISGTTLVFDNAGSVTTGAASTSTITTVTKNGAGAASFNTGALVATTVDVTNGTLTIGDNATSNVTTATIGANRLNYGGGTLGTVTGANGTLSMIGSGTQNVTGNVGTGAQKLTTLDIGGTGTSNFAGEVNATNLTFSSTGTANLANATNNLTAQTIDFKNNAGTVQYGNNVTYTGTASSTGGAAGTVAFGSGATVNGTIGSVGNKIGALTFAGGTNTIGSAIHATTINVNGGDVTSTNTTFDSGINYMTDNTVTLASGTTTVGGNVTTVTPGTGTLVFTGGPLSINGNLGQLKTLNLTNNLTVTGNATAANSMNVAARAMTVNGAFSTTANTQLSYFVTPAAIVTDPPITGKITSTGIATVAAGTRVNMTVDTGVYVPDGQQYTLISGGVGSTVANISSGLTTTSTALLHFKQDTTITDRLVVYASRTQMNNAAKDPNNAAIGTMLDKLGAGGDKDVTDLQVRLANLMSSTEVEQMLSTITPDISGGTAAATTAVGNSSSTIVNNRINSTRNGENFGTGMASGDWAEGGHFWGQAFGGTADQDIRDRVAGYQADSYGVVVGADGEVTDNFRAGVALTYGNTQVDGEDSNNSQADIDSYQVGLYGDYDLGNSYFVSGQLSYMYSDIDTVRYNVGGLAGNKARANFNSDQYTARGEAGREFALDNTFSLTPSAMVNYSYIDIEDYTERGAGGLSLRNVDTDELEILEFGANLIAAAEFEDTIGGTIRPNIHAGYRYDVIGDSVATTGFLAGGGAAFKTQGFEPAQSTVNVGAGVTWETSANIDFTLNYDYEHKSDYEAHSGFARAGYKF